MSGLEARIAGRYVHCGGSTWLIETDPQTLRHNAEKMVRVAEVLEARNETLIREAWTLYSANREAKNELVHPIVSFRECSDLLAVWLQVAKVARTLRRVDTDFPLR